MIPSRTDNESEVDQHRLLLFGFPGQGHATEASTQMQKHSIVHFGSFMAKLWCHEGNRLPVEVAVVLKCQEDSWEFRC